MFKFYKNNYISRSLKFSFWLAVAIFILAAIGGFITAKLNPEQAFSSFEELAKNFAFLKDLSPFLIFIFIFLNNAIKSLIVLLLGFLFGVAPVAFLITNGNMLGLVMAAANSRISLALVLISIIPHGILEIPAVLIASGYGIWLGYRFYRMLAYRENFRNHFALAIQKYFKIVIPMLLGAALIEAFVTPKIIEFIR